MKHSYTFVTNFRTSNYLKKGTSINDFMYYVLRLCIYIRNIMRASREKNKNMLNIDLAKNKDLSVEAIKKFDGTYDFKIKK